jgi:hypothetical protein
MIDELNLRPTSCVHASWVLDFWPPVGSAVASASCVGRAVAAVACRGRSPAAAARAIASSPAPAARERAQKEKRLEFWKLQNAESYT